MSIMIMSINCFSREGADGEGRRSQFLSIYIFLFINNSIGDYLFYIGIYITFIVFFKKMIKRVLSKVFRDIPINKSVTIIVKRSLPPIYIYMVV